MALLISTIYMMYVFGRWSQHDVDVEDILLTDIFASEIVIFRRLRTSPTQNTPDLHPGL